MEPSATSAPLPEEKWVHYSAAVSGSQHDYYLAQFKLIDAGKLPFLSWNWGAILFTFPWLRYRKMYAYSWAYLFVSTPVIFFTFIVADSCAAAIQGHTIALNVIVLVLLLANVLLPLFANRLYFHFVTKKIVIARRRISDKNALWRLLHDSGSTGGYSNPVGAMVILLVVGGILGLDYGGYFNRAEYIELIIASSGHHTSLAEYFEQHQRLPSKIEDIGGFSGPSEKVKAITLEKDGTIRVVAGFAPAAGRAILFTPRVSDGKLAWVCHSDDIPAQCLPVTCRP